MSAIYEPKGAALEYSRLACNLYKGCTHGCDYCYVPGIPPWKFGNDAAETFHSASVPRKNILKQVESAAKKLQGDPREILFCFTCDPFQVGRDNSTTYDALGICGKYGLKCNVLTKGGSAAMPSFPLLKVCGWKFGTTLIFTDDDDRQKHESGAASVDDRIDAVEAAHYCGIETWVSIEPVIYPEQALGVIERLRDVVDVFKVGKLNHDPEREAAVDWSKFHNDVVGLLEGKKYIIKDALKRYGDYSPEHGAIEEQNLGQ